MGALGQFGRSRRAAWTPRRSAVTFADVAGIDEAKMELTEIVDFPQDAGALRAAWAGGCPRRAAFGRTGHRQDAARTRRRRRGAAAFFSISASEFIEAIVGVGASRVRDLFTQARAAAPAIIFIDELDAIGRSRQGSVSVSGANDEREQTLDQILTEMTASSRPRRRRARATNRVDVLDSALLRPAALTAA